MSNQGSRFKALPEAIWSWDLTPAVLTASLVLFTFLFCGAWARLWKVQKAKKRSVGLIPVPLSRANYNIKRIKNDHGFITTPKKHSC